MKYLTTFYMYNVKFLKARVKAGYVYQQDLAERVGVSTATASAWETGRSTPRMEHIENLARALGISMVKVIQMFA